jgi:N-acetylmuramate 1-kinase
MNNFGNMKKIKGDASFRKFFRKKKKNLNSIIVISKKNKNENLLIYDAINKILIKNKILAPNLYEESFNKNYIEIEDFGNETIFKILKKKTNKFFYFKKVIDVLSQIQKIKIRSVKNFKNQIYNVPEYSKKILIREANLFCDWYIKNNLPKKKRRRFIKKFKEIVKDLASNLKLKNEVFVHRDFHVSNLMLVNKKIGVLDSQDALIGNKAYDLASLIDDVRLKTSKLLKNRIYNFFVKKQKKLDKLKFKNDFDILSVLRNLKIIGIFTRLAVRDNKKKYLKLIPHSWELINMRIDKNEIFKDLKNLLIQNFKKSLNEN